MWAAGARRGTPARSSNNALRASIEQAYHGQRSYSIVLSPRVSDTNGDQWRDPSNGWLLSPTIFSLSPPPRLSSRRSYSITPTLLAAIVQFLNPRLEDVLKPHVKIFGPHAPLVPQGFLQDFKAHPLVIPRPKPAVLFPPSASKTSSARCSLRRVSTNGSPQFPSQRVFTVAVVNQGLVLSLISPTVAQSSYRQPMSTALSVPSQAKGPPLLVITDNRSCAVFNTTKSTKKFVVPSHASDFDRLEEHRAARRARNIAAAVSSVAVA
ncbi:hypothetical protein B0H14DRAFT_2576533 [Mycena olivaceomarginata]|nr:hypothetical protein B0H14DRAFT_2576533 [Mycena olivaceomarginata]